MNWNIIPLKFKCVYVRTLRGFTNIHYLQGIRHWNTLSAIDWGLGFQSEKDSTLLHFSMHNYEFHLTVRGCVVNGSTDKETLKECSEIPFQQLICICTYIREFNGPAQFRISIYSCWIHYLWTAACIQYSFNHSSQKPYNINYTIKN